MAIREGRWDCPSCGSVGQLGRNLACSGGGAPRPQGVHFYLPSDDAPPVTDAAQLAQARAGADWVCEHCGGSARATDLACPGCGAPRGESAEQPIHDYDSGAVPHSDAEAAAAEKAESPPQPKTPPRPATAKDWVIVGCTSCGGLGCLGLLLLLLLGMCSAKDDHTQAPQPVRSTQSGPDTSNTYVYNPFTRVVVVGRSWTRSVPVEVNERVTRSGDHLPSDGELIESHEEVTGHEQVFDHNETRTHRVSERVRVGEESYTCGQRDLGNGYFEDRTCTRPVYETQYHTETEEHPVYRTEPVYSRVYRYRVWEWLTDTVLVSESHDSVPPRWPRPRLRGNRRAGTRTESLQVELRGAERTWTVEVPEAQYQRLLPGDSIRIVVEDGEVKHILPIWRGNHLPPSAAARDSAEARDSAAPPPRPPSTRPRHPRRRRSATR